MTALLVGESLLCTCPVFIRWYTDDTIASEPVDVCRCGHPTTEHLNGVGSCTGILERG